MKLTLIAVAAVGALACGAATAGTASVANRNAGLVLVQYGSDYSQNRDAEYWQNRSEDRAARIDEREAHISDRIERGMRNGRITDWEARRLHRQLQNIEAKERDFKANDGRVGAREFNELNRDLDRLAENVRREARDEQRY